MIWCLLAQNGASSKHDQSSERKIKITGIKSKVSFKRFKSFRFSEEREKETKSSNFVKKNENYLLILYRKRSKFSFNNHKTSFQHAQ